MVRMCSFRSLLILSIIAASVVDLPDPVGPGDQHQAARPVGQGGEHRRQVQLLEAADLLGNHPVDRAHRAALVEHVAAEARQPLEAEGEVQLEGFLEPLLLGIGQHAVAQLLGFGGRQIDALEPLQLAVHPHLRRRVGGDVQVRALQLHHRLKQFG